LAEKIPHSTAGDSKALDDSLKTTLRDQGVLSDLEKRLRSCRGAVLLFSGGLDSALLLAAGVRALGGRLTALTLAGPHTAPGELAAAFNLARRLGVKHLVREIDPLALPGFRGNTLERCYVCKQAVIQRGWDAARALDAEELWDGANRDDLADFRPGLRAAQEAGVSSPLLELELGKREIRELSRALGLPWDKPPQSCLATRFPYGATLTREALARVGRAEAWLKARGFSHVRLRVRDGQAVLELQIAELARFQTPGIRRPFLALVAGLGWGSLALATG
jgi:pyridinium-3,5-biscarboxylic acid mononucleotide sulfurtransferase